MTTAILRFLLICNAQYRLHRLGNARRFREWVGGKSTFFTAWAVAA